MIWFFFVFAGWLAVTISGAAGFGGALLLLPAITYVVGAKAAVPVAGAYRLRISTMWMILSNQAIGRNNPAIFNSDELNRNYPLASGEDGVKFFLSDKSDRIGRD